MDGLNLLFLILIYILGGLLLLGLLLVVLGLTNKNKVQLRQGIKGLAIPAGLILVYFFYQFFTDAFLFKPTTQQLIGVYRVSDATNLNFDEDDYDECN